MQEKLQDFRTRVEELLSSWKSRGAPPRAETRQSLQELRESLDRSGLLSLWREPPCVITATLDDGWGHGIATVEMAAEALGARIFRLGLLAEPERIVDSCLQHRCRYLALTVLHSDSTLALLWIRHQLPDDIAIVAGGPGVGDESELSPESGILRADSITDFLEILYNHDTDTGFK